MADNNVNNIDTKLAEEKIWKYLRITTIIGISFICLASTKVLVILEPPIRHFYLTNLRYYLTAVSTSMLVAGSCFCIGGLLGFLFGIPRLINNPIETDNIKNNNQIIENDNLVQISDWVTKIIVGVGLTQFYQISTSLMDLGVYLSPIFNAENIGDKTAKIIAVVIVLYFLVLGFLCAYLWTRLNFSKLLARSQSDVKGIQSELEEKNKELEEKQIELDKKESLLEEQKKELESSNLELETKTDEVSGLSVRFKDKLEDIKVSKSEKVLYFDQIKGKFGGTNKANDRELKASVKETSFDPELFTLSLEVLSTNKDNPLNGSVTFHLHETFHNKEPKVDVINGIAKLSLITYGAFTVGVECDEGKTKLELDLAQLVDAPKLFKER